MKLGIIEKSENLGRFVKSFEDVEVLSGQIVAHLLVAAHQGHRFRGGLRYKRS